MTSTQLVIFSIRLGACYLAWTQAVWTYANCLMSSVNNSLNSTNIRLPCSVCLTVRVRNVMSENNALTAYAAFCHAWHLLKVPMRHSLYWNYYFLRYNIGYYIILFWKMQGFFWKNINFSKKYIKLRFFDCFCAIYQKKSILFLYNSPYADAIVAFFYTNTQ